MSCVETKDHLLNLIRDAGSDASRAEAIETIATVLTHTVDLWVECSYAYKGKEIAEACVRECDVMLRQCGHWKRHDKIAKLRYKCSELATLYFKKHQELMTPA